jgi:hypothetical protein
MKVVMVLVTARMQMSARIKKVHRSSFFKNPRQWEIRTD